MIRPIAALESFALTGPIATFTATIGAGAVATGVHDHGVEHADVYITVGIGLLVLALVEWAIARRFSAHEKQESAAQEQMLASQRKDFVAALERLSDDLGRKVERLTVVFDGQGAVYQEMLRVVRANSEEIRRLAEAVDGLRGRVHRIEDHVNLRPPGT